MFVTLLYDLTIDSKTMHKKQIARTSQPKLLELLILIRQLQSTVKRVIVITGSFFKKIHIGNPMNQEMHCVS